MEVIIYCPSYSRLSCYFYIISFYTLQFFLYIHCYGTSCLYMLGGDMLHNFILIVVTHQLVYIVGVKYSCSIPKVC